MRFSQSIALVTGAGSGIGRETAIRLADEGAKVLLVGRTKSKLEEVAYEINRTKKIPMAEIFQADVTDVEDVKELVDYVQVHFGDLHILVNNAGGSKTQKILDISHEDWDEIQDKNLKSVFLVSKMLGELMIEKVKQEGTGENRAIVNVASLSGHLAGLHFPHYSAAKAGVLNLTRSFALSFAPYGIRVNSVSPGYIETPLTEKSISNEKFMQVIERNTALGRVGKASEVASVILFLASEDASYMTGSDVLVDGGWLIK